MMYTATTLGLACLAFGLGLLIGWIMGSEKQNPRKNPEISGRLTLTASDDRGLSGKYTVLYDVTSGGRLKVSFRGSGPDTVGEVRGEGTGYQERL